MPRATSDEATYNTIKHEQPKADDTTQENIGSPRLPSSDELKREKIDNPGPNTDCMTTKGNINPSPIPDGKYK